MTGRELFRMLVLVLVAMPLTAGAQQATRVYRVALVYAASPVSELAGPEPVHPGARAFVHALRDLGYVEGQNLILERRSAEGKFERFPEIIRELVSTKVDVIVTFANPAIRAAKAVTQTVPIVMIASRNPVEAGLVESFARPGGNITGLTVDTGPEMVGKSLQILKDLLPRISRVIFLASKDEVEAQGRQTAEAATSMGLKLLFAEHAPTIRGGLRPHRPRTSGCSSDRAKRSELRLPTADCRFRGKDATTGHVPGTRVRRGWGADRLRRGDCSYLPPRRAIY